MVAIHTAQAENSDRVFVWLGQGHTNNMQTEGIRRTMNNIAMKGQPEKELMGENLPSGAMLYAGKWLWDFWVEGRKLYRYIICSSKDRLHTAHNAQDLREPESI